ncbi:unnamed protein product, partial [Allacma fusca]
MSNFWSWSPAGAGTANSMYGNFPLFKKTSSGSNVTNNIPSKQFINPSFPQQNGLQPQMMPTFVTPAPNDVTPIHATPVEVPQGEISQDSVPKIHTSVAQARASPTVPNSAPTPADQQNGTEDATIEYLHGDAAAAYLQQMNIPNDYMYQYQQPSQANQGAPQNVMNPSNDHTNITYQQAGSGDNSGTQNNTWTPELSENNNNTNQQLPVREDAADASANYTHAPNMPTIAVQGATNNTNNMGLNDQAARKKSAVVGKFSKLLSPQRFVQHVSYEGPPETKPSPNAKPIQPQGKPTILSKKHLTLKPKFHLCGRCNKCKAIQSNPGIPNM